MRLIDAHALQDEIQKSKMENPHKDAKVAKNHEFEHEHFMKMVVMQPTAQKEDAHELNESERIVITEEDAETLIAFIKMHEREEIPDDVWDVCTKLYDLLEDM